MPTVPRTQRRVDTAPIPGVRLRAAENADSAGVNLEDAKARTAGAMANLGGTVAGIGLALTHEQRQIADQEKERADQVAVLNAENQLSAWETQRLYDPNSGALTVKGKDSFGLPETVVGEYQQKAGEVEAGLGTDRQRLAFARVKLQRQGDLDMTLRRHVFGEMQRYQGQELDAYVDNARNAAIANAADPRRVGLELGRAVDAIRTHAKQLGLGPEQITEKVATVESATHIGVIDQLLAQDQTRSAQVYFEETRGSIKGESLARIEKALEEGGLRKDSQKRSDAIIAAGGTLTDQREKVRAIDDPKLRDAVQERVEHNAIIKERADREQEQATLRGVYDILDRSHDVASIPAGTWAGMEPSQRAAARGYANSLAKGVGVETDNPTYYALMQQAAGDPETFATQNLLNYKHKLSEADFKHFADMQGAVVRGDRASADKQLGNFRTHEQLVDDSLSLYGIDPRAKPASKEGAAIAQFRRMLDTRVEALTNLTGKKPSNDEIQKTIDQLLSTNVETPGSWWNIWPGGESFTATKKRLIDVTIDDVPDTDKQQITDALKRRNRPVSPATILDLYLERKARGVK